MNYEGEKKTHISFCGSYCHICDWFTGKIKNTARQMLNTVEEYNGFERVLKEKVSPEDLKTALKLLAETRICSGCKTEARERCKIVVCCVSKGFSHCDECENFPCNTLKENPGVIKFHTIDNLLEMKKVGVKEWIDNQWE